MGSFHREIPALLVNQFSDLNTVFIAEADANDPISKQIDIIATQVESWSKEWKERAKFLTKKIVPLGVKIALVDVITKDGRRFCRYEALLRL